ncbi:MAG: prepilin-type N-terminal cleavage/methylation domain-containing protein [Candidatus Paceibacteria bacterium]|jgi:prepilin-type N-terminal cleavage/methylation domain-containing protein
MTHQTQQQKEVTQYGFSLVEFIVVLSIFSIMSSISIFNYNEYQATIRATNVSQDIGLSIRQAQVYGISATDRIVGEDGIDPENLFGDGESIEDITQDRSIRGIYIDTDNDAITIFEDLNRDFKYVDSTDRIIDTRSVLGGQVEILGVDLCNTNPTCNNIQTNPVHIVFQRPYPDAYISADESIGFYDYASILVGDSSDYDRYIEVSAIGNISVKNNYGS